MVVGHGKRNAGRPQADGCRGTRRTCRQGRRPPPRARNELASALATGQKRTLPDGREVTESGGKWYYSDPGDSSSFLKEHGAKPKMEVRRPAPAAAAAAPTMSRAELMAKLEERLILGEISEETYRDLKRKYEALPQKPKKPAASDEWEEAGKTG